MAAIDGIKQLNTEIVSGAQTVSSDNTVMSAKNLNRTSGKGHSTSNAGTEELEKNEKVTQDYVDSKLAQIARKYRIYEGSSKKNIDAEFLTRLILEKTNIDENKLYNMDKKSFERIVVCLEAALEDSSKDGVCLVSKLNNKFWMYSSVVTKHSDKDATEIIKETKEKFKEFENKSLSEKLGGIDINNQEEVEKAIEKFIKHTQLTERLKNATTENEKKQILADELDMIVVLLNNASDSEKMKVGIALLKVAQKENLGDVIVTVVQSFMTEENKQKFISAINNHIQDFVALGIQPEQLQKVIDFLLGKAGNYENVTELLSKISEVMTQLENDTSDAIKKVDDYVRTQKEQGRDFNQEPLTDEEIINVVGNKEQAQKYIALQNIKSMLPNSSALIIKNTHLTEEQQTGAIGQAYQIAQNHGFGEEFLQGVNDYIKEHGEDFEISQEKINEILNNATEGRYSEVTGEGVEAQAETTEAGFGVTEEAGGLIPTEEIVSAQGNVEALKDKIASQTKATKEAHIAEVKSAGASEGSTNFFTMAATTVAEKGKTMVAKGFSEIVKIAKEGESTIKTLTDMGINHYQAIRIGFTEEVSDSFRKSSLMNYFSSTTSLQERLGVLAKGDIAMEIAKDDKCREFLDDDVREKYEKQEMGV